METKQKGDRHSRPDRESPDYGNESISYLQLIT